MLKLKRFYKDNQTLVFESEYFNVDTDYNFEDSLCNLYLVPTEKDFQSLNLEKITANRPKNQEDLILFDKVLYKISMAESPIKLVPAFASKFENEHFRLFLFTRWAFDDFNPEEKDLIKAAFEFFSEDTKLYFIETEYEFPKVKIKTKCDRNFITVTTYIKYTEEEPWTELIKDDYDRDKFDIKMFKDDIIKFLN